MHSFSSCGFNGFGKEPLFTIAPVKKQILLITNNIACKNILDFPLSLQYEKAFIDRRKCKSNFFVIKVLIFILPIIQWLWRLEKIFLRGIGNNQILRKLLPFLQKVIKGDRGV
jgi:hypothetical protein